MQLDGGIAATIGGAARRGGAWQHLGELATTKRPTGNVGGLVLLSIGRLDVAGRLRLGVDPGSPVI